MHILKICGTIAGNFNYLLRLLLSLDQNDTHWAHFIVKLSSVPFSEWPGNTGLGTRGSHIQAFGPRRSAKRALREPQWEAGSPRDPPRRERKGGLGTRGVSGERTLEEREDAAGAPDAGPTGRARLGHRRRGRESLTLLFLAHRGCVRGLLGQPRSLEDPIPRARHPARPAPAARNVPADLGPAAALLRWCRAPRRPGPGRSASFDLRLPELSCRDRPGPGRDLQPLAPTSPVTSDLPRGASGRVRARVGGWIRVGVWSLPVCTLDSGADGSSPEATSPGSRRGGFKAHPAPKQMFIMKTRDACQVEDPQGLSAEYGPSPVQWSLKAKR